MAEAVHMKPYTNMTAGPRSARAVHLRHLRNLRLPRSRDRGQVLLIAVIILFAVATLAALFIGLLGANIVQVTRYADVSSLRQVAEAGLRLANHDLVYGTHGADWQPSSASFQSGRGLVQVKVSYGPTPSNVQSRYLLISATATFPDDPFASYTILTIKPLLLTDYARCITDYHELRQPAALGVTGLEAVGQVRTGYTSTISGPIFSNTDLIWYGNSQVNLSTSNDYLPSDFYGTGASVSWGQNTMLRDDRIEVAGQMRSGAYLGTNLAANDAALAAQPLKLTLDQYSRSLTLATNAFRPDPNAKSPINENYEYGNGFVDVGPAPAYSPVATNAWHVLADLPTYSSSLPLTAPLPGGAYSVPRIHPPRMDAVEPDLNTNRYLTLTRDSGPWLPNTANTAYYNPGAGGWGWVYGGGLYIDNTNDLQYVDGLGHHDLEKLRQDWLFGLTPEGTATPGRTGNTPDWWDQTGRYYAPPGVEIVLHGEATCPYIEITRHLGDNSANSGASCVWLDPTGAAIPAGTAYTYQPIGTMCHPLGGNGLPPIGVDQNGSATFPFPPNGVIYAEGNVRIRGVMPPNRHPTANSPYYGSDYNPANQWGRTRKYDLQVVSGGTIYIEGDLLTPVGAKLYQAQYGTLGTTPQQLLSWDSYFGTRLALIAHDSVCLNTTALHPRPANLYLRDSKGNYTKDTFNDSQPVYPSPDPGFPPYMFFAGPQDAASNASPADGPLPNGYFPTSPQSITFNYNNVRLATNLAQGLTPSTLQLLIGHSAWYCKGGGTAAPPPFPVPSWPTWNRPRYG